MCYPGFCLLHFVVKPPNDHGEALVQGEEPVDEKQVGVLTLSVTPAAAARLGDAGLSRDRWPPRRRRAYRRPWQLIVICHLSERHRPHAQRARELGEGKKGKVNKEEETYNVVLMTAGFCPNNLRLEAQCAQTWFIVRFLQV